MDSFNSYKIYHLNMQLINHFFYFRELYQKVIYMHTQICLKEKKC